MKSNQPRVKVTRHQKKILAALAKLASHHGHRWWSRQVIGEVVQAGGFHNVIQVKTMLALRTAGLAMLERQSWPAEVQKFVRCNCGMYHWGLTEAGEKLAATIAVSWPDEIEKKLLYASYHDNCRCEGNGDGNGDLFVPPRFEDNDDDDFQESRDPSPVSPIAPALV